MTVGATGGSVDMRHSKRKLVLLLVASGVLFSIFVIDLWCISFMHIRITL